jgi:hypothetical protein
MLKWERYSSVDIPPFPTSSMSGSESINKLHLTLNSRKGKPKVSKPRGLD